MNIQDLICPHVYELEAYEAPDWQALAHRAGLPTDRLVRLDANENPHGLTPKAVAALARFGGYGFYPDYRPLVAAIARYAGVPAECVVLGNGGDEIIDLAVRTFVAPGDEAIVCTPAFGMYAVSVAGHRGRVQTVPTHDDFSPDVAAIEALFAHALGIPEHQLGPDTATPGITEHQLGRGRSPKLLFLTSPGNPAGQSVPLDTVRRLLALPLAIVVDQAYLEFGGESATPLLDEYPNLVIARTFSKWAGLAGLRLGYALASPEVAAAMNRLRPPYNVNVAAAVAALAILDDPAEAQDTVARIVAERERLQAALADIPGIQPLPSQANFVLCRLDGRSGRETAAALAGRGILVRSFADPRLATAIRITIGRPEQNDALLAALRTVLDPGTATPASKPPTPRSTDPPTARAPARHAEIHRQTRETDVTVSLDLDGSGGYEIDTGVGFFDHMLAQLAAHGLFDLVVHARGDLQIDEHHTVEDVAIALGQALDAALGDRAGIVRMGQAWAPLDEALAHVVVDLSGRPYAVVDAEFATPRVGALGTDLIPHFLETLAFQARLSLHARLLYGRNDHHRAESLFKALGRALDAATRIDPRRQGVPSTKGVL
jgi:histidinol-phosphate aminotransferase